MFPALLYTTQIDIHRYGHLLYQLTFWAHGEEKWGDLALPLTTVWKNHFIKGYTSEPTAATLAQLSVDCTAHVPERRPTARQALARLG